MSPRLRHLLTLLLAFLMSVNALGASVAQLAPGDCCGERKQSGAAVAVASAPCHAALFAAEACDHDGAGSPDRGGSSEPACDDQCVRCAAFHASSPAFLVMTAGNPVFTPTSYEIPMLKQGALPALRGERLDRPPAVVPLN